MGINGHDSILMNLLNVFDLDQWSNIDVPRCAIESAHHETEGCKELAPILSTPI